MKKRKTKLDVYKQLTEPQYIFDKKDTIEAVLRNVKALCTQLRLGQRYIAIIGVRKNVKKRLIDQVIKETNSIIKDYKDEKVIKCKLIKMKAYNSLILFNDDLYFKLFEEACSKKECFSPYLFHYIFTKLFGYSDTAYKLFLKKWVDE